MADIYFRPDGQNRFQIRSAAGLTLPSAWLDQEYNRIYTYLNTIESGGATTGSEWATVQVEATKVSSDSFSVEGDYTNVFQVLRAIQLKDDNDVYASSHIKTSVYVGGTNTTTVTLYDNVVPTTFTGVNVGLIGEEAQSLPSMQYTTRLSSYTVTANDQIIFTDDSNIGNLREMYDEGQINGDPYYALIVVLPTPSDMPGKLLCVKKIAGGYRTIISSSFTRTDETVPEGTQHNYTYVFPIYGDSDTKNRITLMGNGDCAWLFSNGSRWYELTPEASESVKGIVRLATNEEMSLTAEQLANNESLSRTLAVSPYQLEEHYLRSDASNIKLSSNFIYKTPDDVTGQTGVAAYLEGVDIIVPKGVGVNIPNGRDENGVALNIQVETQSMTRLTSLGDVTAKPKKLFLVYDPTTSAISFRSFFEKNVTYGYGNNIGWLSEPRYSSDRLFFNYAENIWQYSSDGGTNWTRFYGAVVCVFWGNGSSITNVYTRSASGLATRDEIAGLSLNYIVKQDSTGNSWYRIWLDGTIEQGGKITPAAQYNYNSFITPFTTICQTIIATAEGPGNATDPNKISINNPTTQGFTSCTGFGAEGRSPITFWWFARGY